MSDTCETVRVVTQWGPVDINKSDLTPEHKLWTPEAGGADDFSKMNADELRAFLTASGVKFAKHATMETLRAECRKLIEG